MLYVLTFIPLFSSFISLDYLLGADASIFIFIIVLWMPFLPCFCESFMAPHVYYA